MTVEIKKVEVKITEPKIHQVTAESNPKVWAMLQPPQLAPQPCDQCGNDMGYAYLLGSTCLACCKANHKRIMGR